MCEADGELDSEGDASMDRRGAGGMGWALFVLLGIGGWRVRRACRRA